MIKPMIAVVDIEHPSFAATVSGATLPVPLPEVEHDIPMNIILPDFNCNFSASLADLTTLIDSTKMIAKAVLDKHVNMTLTLTGKLVEDNTVFQIKETALLIKPTKELARADFIASTLNALLALGREVRLQIPDLALDLDKLSFDLSLLEASRLLQTRQTAYRLMVIEQATGIEFLLPPYFSGDEMSSIIYTYRAIIDRSFDWPFESYPLRIPANEEWFNRITAMNQPISITYTLEQEGIMILGKPILLGDVRVTIEDAVIQNRDQVKEQLAQLDGHEIEIIIQSAKGQARFELPDAPRLPDRPWDSNIRALIDLESQLDNRLCEGYNALAAATLAGLTEEEKAQITARPELDEEAFLIEGWNREDS